jgi:hypothetical protein
MGKLLATIYKELLLLWRDRAGLMVLFIMPAVLVVVMSLVQENILKIMGETSTRVLFVDLDQNQLGKNIEEKLETAGTLEIIKKIAGRQIDPEAAIAAINRGSYQFGIIIPKGFTQAVGQRARQLTYESLAMPGATSAENVAIPDLVVYFDPAVRGTFRSAVLNALNNVVLAMEVNQKIKAFSEILPQKINKDMEESLGPVRDFLYRHSDGRRTDQGKTGRDTITAADHAGILSDIDRRQGCGLCSGLSGAVCTDSADRQVLAADAGYTAADAGKRQNGPADYRPECHVGCYRLRHHARNPVQYI